jgi:hypothetical protein
MNNEKYTNYTNPEFILKVPTITLTISEYEQLMAIKKAACIYVREEVNWEDAGLHDEGGDEKAMEWFVNEYSEHNYG